MRPVATTAFLVLLAIAGAGCGGSSSETPFPLEPDLSRLDGGSGRNAPYVVYSGKPAEPPAPDAGALEPLED